MKDKDGNTIHIGEIVTLTEETRPKRLIGRRGKVLGLGDVRVHITLLPSRYSDAEEIRIEADKVLVGEHIVHDPAECDPKFQAIVKDLVANRLAKTLFEGVEQAVITREQMEQLIKLFFDEKLNQG